MGWRPGGGAHAPRAACRRHARPEGPSPVAVAAGVVNRRAAEGPTATPRGHTPAAAGGPGSRAETTPPHAAPMPPGCGTSCHGSESARRSNPGRYPRCLRVHRVEPGQEASFGRPDSREGTSPALWPPCRASNTKRIGLRRSPRDRGELCNGTPAEVPHGYIGGRTGRLGRNLGKPGRRDPAHGFRPTAE
jgi:hypothetical protein